MKKKKKVIIIIIALVIIGAAAGGILLKYQASKNSNEQEEVGMYAGTPAVTLHKQDLSSNINVTGIVESQNIIKVTTNLAQSIKTLNVGLGDEVKEGDILCIFDDTEIKKEIESLKETISKSTTLNENQKKANLRALETAKEDKGIQLNSAQRAINEAQQELDKANQKYNNSIDTYNNLVVQAGNLKNILDTTPAPDYSLDENISGNDSYSQAQQNYETAKLELEQSKAEMETYEEQIPSFEKAVVSAQEAYDTTLRSCNQQIEACQETIDNQDLQNGDNSQQAQLEKLEDSLENTVVKAPKDGTISSLSIAEGSMATDGTIMTIENTSSLKITVDIKESDILKVKEGMEATITADATGDTEISGKVNKVITTLSSGGNIAGGLGETTSSGYKAEISITGDSQLLIGMNAKAKIILDKKTDAYAVPYDAIITNENGDDVVYVATPIDSNEMESYQISELKVTKGMDTSYYTEISGSQLEDGMIIITDPYSVVLGDTVNNLDIQNLEGDLENSKEAIVEGGEEAIW